MRIDGFQCDVCKILAQQTDYPVDGLGLPEKWMLIHQTPSTKSSMDMHFCSMDCLQQWIAERVAANNIILHEDKA